MCLKRIRRAVSVYTRRLSLCAHANENGIKLGNLNGQKTLGASRRSPIPCENERAGRWAINQKMLVCKSNPIFDGGTHASHGGGGYLAALPQGDWRKPRSSINTSCHFSRATYVISNVQLSTGLHVESSLIRTPCDSYLRNASNIGENAPTKRYSLSSKCKDRKEKAYKIGKLLHVILSCFILSGRASTLSCTYAKAIIEHFLQRSSIADAERRTQWGYFINGENI